MDEQPRTRHTHLAGVAEDAVGCVFSRPLEIRVRKHDDRRLAAQFEGDALEVARGGRDDRLAHHCRARERDLVDLRVRDQRPAGRIPESGHDVDHTGREAHLLNQFGQPDRRQRRQLGRFEHDGAAHRQRRSDLGNLHRQRKIPRCNRTHHPDRFPQRISMMIGRGQCRCLAIDLAGPAGVVAQTLRRPGHGGKLRHHERHAIVHALERRQLVSVRLDLVGKLQQQVAAAGRRQVRPRSALECPAGGLDRRVDVIGIGSRSLREDFTGRRIDDVECLARLRRHETAVDEQPVRSGQEVRDQGFVARRRNLRVHKISRCVGRAWRARYAVNDGPSTASMTAARPSSRIARSARSSAGFTSATAFTLSACASPAAAAIPA